MSILIKGMEMPKTGCIEVRLFSDGWAHVDTSEPPYNKAYEVYSIPPHGELIERTALRESFRESIEACHKWADEMREAGNEEMIIRAEQSLGTFVECSLRAKNAPTIIPASEEDDE